MPAASGDKKKQGETSTNVVDDQLICDDFDIDVVIENPKVGMEFNTYDDVVDYYARYARQEGFVVCGRTSKKGKDGKLRYASVECFKGEKPRDKRAKSLKPRPQSKVDCPARIRACLSTTEKWRLTFVYLEHNHDQSPGKARHFKSNRIIDEETKRKLVFHDLAGIRLNKTFDLLRIEAGERPEDLPYLQRDFRNELAKARRLRLVEGDAEAMNNYFTRMKADNEDFFYALDLNEKGRLRNVFWADARRMAACREFGDIVTFDTTYLVNRYDMPFAPFVSVNHHGHSVLLGCGLVSHEDTDSFIWLFQTWLTCMRGSAPNAIITDQCMAMKKAIEFVFPASRHRWCIWHIMKKLPEKLNGYKEYRQISYSMKQAVYESLTIEDFEAAWSSFITKYDLQCDKWLDGLYVERGHWVPAFVNGIFWAGMSSTQRSENINWYFDGYINARTTLKQFVEQYEAALTKKVEIEKEDDATSWKTFIPLISSYDLETQFQSVYTHNKVREFQDEIRRILNCQVWTRSNIEYEIKEWISFEEGGDKYKSVCRTKFYLTKTRKKQNAIAGCLSSKEWFAHIN